MNTRFAPDTAQVDASAPANATGLAALPVLAARLLPASVQLLAAQSTKRTIPVDTGSVVAAGVIGDATSRSRRPFWSVSSTAQGPPATSASTRRLGDDSPVLTRSYQRITRMPRSASGSDSPVSSVSPDAARGS